MFRTILIIAYFVIGALVAQANGYLGQLGDISSLISAVLAVVLWPLVLIGVDLHIGALPKGRKR